MIDVGGPTRIACAGCGWRLPDAAPVVLRCPAAVPGDDVDHVLERHLDPGRLRFPGGREPEPFVRYRTLLHAYHAARALGWTDAEFVALIDALDSAVVAVDGRGFRETPFVRSDALSDRLGFAAAGGVWVKDETAHVSGSHKARHLMGTMIELEVAEAVRTGDVQRAGGHPRSAPDAGRPGVAPGVGNPGGARLAIASCGNAALAAAVVARAAGRALDVYITEEADPSVVARLVDLGANVEVCLRTPGIPGDPSYLRLLAAVDEGAVPFTCQGNLNGLAIEGGETLGWEIASAALASGLRLDRLFVQVGGGALAASTIGAFRDARLLGAPVDLPRLHAVQAEGVAPLARAHDRVLAALRAARVPVAAGVALDLADPSVATVLSEVAHHRSAYMWPWEVEPHSIAGGILDDETYDWMAVVRGTLASGGWPLVVNEATLAAANELGRSATGIDVDPTGSSGLAGLMQMAERGLVGPDESVAVLFTGVRRGPPATTSGAQRGDGS